jgi:endonuclease/exonuclease/phosphatase family metal-dependent hydrolase
MFTRKLESGTHEVGITIASRTPLRAWSYYYHIPEENMTRNKEGKPDHRSFGYIMSETVVNGEQYRIGTTHFWDSADGHTDAMQRALIRKLIPALESELPHILCGDFNIPRGHNALYDKLTVRYNESIPLRYHSSLDRNLHKLGKAELDEPIFDEYMVDYILTEEPYIASDTKLHFGVSDHAAVSSTIIIRP